VGLEEGEHFEDLLDLFQWVKGEELIEAHNGWFERGIWQNKMEKGGWPRIQHRQWRCSAAKAAAHSLPRNLEDAVDSLGLPLSKDLEGAKLMKKMVKPHKPRKADKIAWFRLHAPCGICCGSGKVPKFLKDGFTLAKHPSKCPVCGGVGHGSLNGIPPLPLLYHATSEQLQRLFLYCRNDVLAEEAFSRQLWDLNETETEMYLLDQCMNERGFMLDGEGVEAALSLIDGEFSTLNTELCELTDGTVTKATQRDAMIEWLESLGLDLPNTKKETIEAYLDPEYLKFNPMDPAALRGMEIMKQIGKSSTAKYVKMRGWSCSDGRARGGLLYHGAGTGRWSGSGIQPHNFPKGAPWFKDQELLWALLKTRNAMRIVNEAPKDKKGNPLYTTVMDALSQGLRGAIVPGVGKCLYVADYAAIEARVLLWLAGEEEALEIFRRGEDIYLDMATAIYGYLCNDKELHAKERNLGKPAVLGLGYQMGAAKFVATAAMYGVEITEEFAKVVVEAYRAKYWRVKQMWRDIEDSAIMAVHTGQRIQCGYVAWFVEEGFLYCELPSGRYLAYPDPQIRQTMTSWGAVRDQLTFMGIGTYSKKWSRQSTYGGSLVENITQAVARDLMAEATLRLERGGVYEPILTVHDEIIAEAIIGTGNVKVFEALMAECPDWADGCPVAAEGWTGMRYRK